MNQRSCMRDFARYTILSVLGTLGVSCYILADTFFVSKGLDANGLTALNLAIPVYNFIHGTGLMLGMGGATRFSICKSQGKTDEVNRIYTNTIYIAAYGIVANISLVIIAVYTGIAQGIQPLISTFYGGGNDRQTKTVLRYAVMTMLFVSVIVYLLIFIYAQPITSVFNSENNIGLQQIAITGLKLYFISTPFVGYNIILATFFTSIEKALPAYILSVLRGLILIIPMAFFLSALWEMTGVWLAYPITEVFVALLGVVIYKQKIKKGTTNYEN